MYTYIGITAIVLSITVVFFVFKFPTFKTAYLLFFIFCIILLSGLLIKNIFNPISFNNELKTRELSAIEQLKIIRKVQLAYKDKYGKYSGSFDTLIHFSLNDSIEIKRIITIGNWYQDSISKEEALNNGILKEYISKKAVVDSFFKDDIYSIEKLGEIPNSNGSKFTMTAGEISTGYKTRLNVFEVYVLYDTLLKNMNRQLVINYKADQLKLTGFEGIKVGSLTEATNNIGNWEK